MIASIRHRSLVVAAFIFAVLLLPPVMQALQGSMTTQMLVQIPLLIAVGYLLRAAVPQRLAAAISAWNLNGISGMLLATFTTAFWMLPRLLDAAASEPLFTLAKFVSVPLLIGLPMGLSWPRMNFVVRGVFLMELIAMFFRFGWLYLISPVRLCNNYLLDDQQRTGQFMLLIGATILVWAAFKLLWGHFNWSPDNQRIASIPARSAPDTHRPADR